MSTKVTVVLAGALALSLALAHGQGLRGSDPTTDDDVLLNGAARKFAAGQWEEAVRVCDGVLARNPGCLRAYSLRGMVYFLHNQSAKSLADGSEILKRDPNHLVGHQLVAAALAQLGRRDEAVTTYTRLIELDPKDTRSYVQRAALYVELGRPADAEADLNRAVQVNSGDLEAFRLRANCRASRGDLAGAAADLATVARSDSSDHESRVKLACILSRAKDDRLRDGSKALDYAKKAAELTKGSNYEAYDALASAYAELGQFAEAISAAKKALELAEGSVFADVRAMRRRLELYQAGKPCRE